MRRMREENFYIRQQPWIARDRDIMKASVNVVNGFG